MARIKTVLGNKNDVAHAWANQTAEELNDNTERGERGRQSHWRIFFQGPTIFSYGRHFPMATFFQRKGKPQVVLFTTQTHSVTTAQHLHVTRGAISGVQVIYCKEVLEAAQGIHGNNLEAFEAKAKAAALQLPKCRKPERYLQAIAHQLELATAYAEYFNLKIGKYKHLQIKSKDGGIEATAKEIAGIKRAKAVKAKREAEAAALSIEEFRAFRSRSVYYSEYTFLRYQPNEKEIETSKGVRVAKDDAQKYYNRLKSLQFRYNSQGYLSTNDQGSEFQGFKLRNITEDHFEIGCHKIQFSELDRVAKAAGLKLDPIYQTTKEG